MQSVAFCRWWFRRRDDDTVLAASVAAATATVVRSHRHSGRRRGAAFFCRSSRIRGVGVFRPIDIPECASRGTLKLIHPRENARAATCRARVGHCDFMPPPTSPPPIRAGHRQLPLLRHDRHQILNHYHPIAKYSPPSTNGTTQ